jgi:hypothetical protein
MLAGPSVLMRGVGFTALQDLTMDLPTVSNDIKHLTKSRRLTVVDVILRS